MFTLLTSYCHILRKYYVDKNVIFSQYLAPYTIKVTWSGASAFRTLNLSASTVLLLIGAETENGFEIDISKTLFG
jgi:hypothetical protein